LTHRDLGLEAVGQQALLKSSGTAKILGFPAWEELTNLLVPTVMPRKHLFTNYTSSIAETELRGRIRNVLSLPRTGKPRMLKSPYKANPILVGEDLIDHLLSKSYPHRGNVNHMQPLPLIEQTITSPWEIWQRSITPENPKSAIIFLAVYQMNGVLKNHFVLVSKKLRVITAYFMASIEQTENHREGQPAYLRWCAR
jgi:hypothetical protein